MMRTPLVFLTAAVLVPTLAATQQVRLGSSIGKKAPRAGASEERIDFEGFPAGKVLTQLTTDAGSGPVTVRGFNPFLGGANAALVFDTGFPTGGDFDLGTPNIAFGGPGIGVGGQQGPFRNDRARGKVLIVAENLVDWDLDGLVNSPDDLNAAATTEGTLRLEFAALGPVTILGLTVLDVEASELPPYVTFLDTNGNVLSERFLPATGDNGVVDFDLGGVAGVGAMVVHMRGSGAIDDLRLRREGTGTIDLYPDLSPIDLTPAGDTAVLFDFFSTEGDVYFLAPETGTLTFKTTVGSPLRAFPTGISATKRVSAIHGDPNEAGLWTEAGGWLDLGNVYPAGCGGDQGGAWDIQADGRAAVGLLWNGCFAEAFHWSAGGGLMALDLLGEPFFGSTNPPVNRATKISDDGTRIGGFAQREFVDRWPALWRPDGSGFLLPEGEFTPDSPGEVLSVNADGSMAAGIWNLEGFYWTEAEGVVRLGTIPGGQTYPNAIAAGCRLIFGKNQAGFFDPPTAFVWTRNNGLRSLTDIAIAHGAVLPPGVVLDNVLAASADGTVVLGTALDPFFRIYTFVLRMPVSAYGL